MGEGGAGCVGGWLDKWEGDLGMWMGGWISGRGDTWRGGCVIDKAARVKSLFIHSKHSTSLF